MGLRVDPQGSGQINQALRKVLEVEQQPIKNLEGRKTVEEAKGKLFQEFKGKFNGIDKLLNEMSSVKKLRELKIDLGDGQNLVGVTVNKEVAQPGSYQIEVLQMAERSSMISNPIKDPNAANLGTGYISFTGSDGEDFEIFVEEDQASLNGIANLVNSNAKSPVRVAVVKDSDDPERPFRMIVTAKKDGEANKVKFPDFYFLGGDEDFYIDDDKDSKNAKLKVDGFDLEEDSNVISDFLPGVTLQLKAAKEGQPFTLNITEDTSKVALKIKALVDQVNQVLDFINKQNAIDQHTDTKSTFAGDTGLQNIEFRLRNIFHEGFSSTPNRDDDAFRLYFMHDFGVEFEKSGALKFNEQKFNQSFEKDVDGVTQALTGEFGFVFQMKSVMNGYMRPGNGLLALREGTLRERVSGINKQIERAQLNFDRKSQALTEKFAKMQAALASMQQQQQYVSAAIGSAGGGSNITQQLLGG